MRNCFNESHFFFRLRLFSSLITGAQKKANQLNALQEVLLLEVVESSFFQK